jgi:transmembrane 9 superfamily protein 2/4
MSNIIPSIVSIFILTLLSLKVNAISFPGVPNNYHEGDKIPILVNSLVSSNTAFPYDYYNEHFGFCQPEGGPTAKKESLGSILFGDRLYDSSFDIFMLKNDTCQSQCRHNVTIDEVNAKFINERIMEQYNVRWIVDNIPAARKMKTEEGEILYSEGFELGLIDEEGKPAINNHFDIQIEYHINNGRYRIVGVLVWPYSIKNIDRENKCSNIDSTEHQYLSETSPTTFSYTFNVIWTESPVAWVTRWDHYIYNPDAETHWLSLINSFVIAMMLTGMVAMIIIRALRKDIIRYNRADLEDQQDEYGWKLVHGDVFRAPFHRMWLSVLLGNGVQSLLMCLVTLCFAVLGFLSPASRGSIPTVMILFYLVFSCFSGYVSARMYKVQGGEGYKRNAIFTAFLFPGAILIVYLFLNMFMIANDSSGAIPFGTLILIISIWTLVSIPLCFFGAIIGFKRKTISIPVRTNQIPRQVPDQPMYLRFIPSSLIGGVLPFGAIFIEVFYIMNSIIFHHIYSIFSFLFLGFLILIITCAEISILICYFRLCSEDYRWWWHSFVTSGSCALYIFLYSVLYYCTKLSFDSFSSSVLYFGFSAIFCSFFFIISGTIGFFATFWFLRKIYGSIKID